MKFPIDVIFVDEKLRVLSVCENITPWKILNSAGKKMSFFQYYLQPSTYDLKNYFQHTSVFEFQAGTLSEHSIQKEINSMWTLRFLNGPKKGSYIPLSSGSNKIGRSSSCAVQIQSPGISKVHAEIQVQDTEITLSDQNSSNGLM